MGIDSNRQRRSLSIVAPALMFLLITVSSLPAAAAGGGGGGPSVGGKRDPGPAYQRGVEHLKAQQFSEAQRDFETVLKIAPDNPHANLMMGMALEGQQNLKGAQKAYLRASKRDRKLYEARARLGIVEIKLGRREEAEEELADLKKARDRCADKCAADIVTRIQAAIDAISSSLADKHPGTPVSGLPATRSDGERLYLAAVELIHRQQYARAIESLKQSEAAFGPNADILTYLGYAHRKLGQFDESRAYYAQALVIDPDHRGANEYLGELFLQTGQVDLALRQLEVLQSLCTFGCAEEEQLRRWIAASR